MLEIEGYAVHWNVKYEDDNEQIAAGAFDQSIAERSPLPIMYYHDDFQPLGTVTEFRTTSKGLWIRGLIYVETVFEHIRRGSLRGLSIHYIEQEEIFKPVESEKIITRATLMEISLVSCPASPYFIDTYRWIEDKETSNDDERRLDHKQLEL